MDTLGLCVLLLCIFAYTINSIDFLFVISLFIIIIEMLYHDMYLQTEYIPLLNIYDPTTIELSNTLYILLCIFFCSYILFIIVMYLCGKYYDIKANKIIFNTNRSVFNAF